jgi:WD40 repeat protein/serine/threonine protein kinase
MMNQKHPMAAISPELKAIFCEALDCPSGAERQAFLDRACAGDHALRARIDALLAAGHDAGDFLEQPMPAPSTTWNPPEPLETSGTIIGLYKLLEQIGEGGMGTVYMAEQEQPVRRKVALKIIKPGMDSRQVIARFEAERQALAMMDHRNIARVLDAGTTPAISPPCEGGARGGGRPYFVMELVHGVPITQFCDDRKLTLRERLELLVPVCQAIQYAHQKGIIHRDIKPSNVLVTMYDDKPVPKVIDFGVAKAVEHRLTEKTMFTQFGALVGTFEYMSPEQAEMNAFGVDTRRDIYSLGVLLYELLTGTTPLEQKRLREAALTEMVRLIKEEEAPRPSVRLSSSNNLPKIAAARNTDPGRLSGIVRGELDWIVMKCLEKDRTRRYESASGLARDIERYLSDEPVEACPPSAGYRLRKFARKYRAPLRAAAAFLLLLILGVVASTWQAIRATVAERAAQSSERVAENRKLEADVARNLAERRREEVSAVNDNLRRANYVSDMNLARVAWDENNVSRTRELLEKHRLRAGDPDLRGFEWYYLDRLARGGQLRIDAHAGGVSAVDFMPDGRRLISAGIAQPLRKLRADKGTPADIKLWDALTGRPLPLQLDGPSSDVAAVALAPDGTLLAATRRDHTILVWDLDTGGLVTLEGPANQVAFSVRFSPDSKRLASLHSTESAGSQGGPVVMEIWDLASRKLVVTVNGLPALLRRASFSPDGKRVAACTFRPGAIIAYDAETGREVFSCNDPDGADLTRFVFSPDGTRLATYGHTSIRLWDVTSRKPAATWPSESEYIHCLVYSRDGTRLAAGGIEGIAEIWDTETGRKVQALKGHSGSIPVMALSPDGTRLVTGGADGTLRVWDIAGPGDPAAISRSESELRSVIPDVRPHARSLSPDGRSLMAGVLRDQRQFIELWDTAKRRRRGSPIDLPQGWICHAWSADGERLYLADIEKTVHVVETGSGHVIRRFHVDAEPRYYSAALSPDEKWFAYSGSGGTIRVQDVRTGAVSPIIQGLGDEPQALSYNPEGSRLLGANQSGVVRIWDPATGREIAATTLPGGSYIDTIRYSRNGELLAVVGHRRPVMTGEVRILDAASARELRSLRGHALNVLDADFSPDGRRLVTAGADRTIRFWDLGTGQESLKLSGDPLVSTIRLVSGGRRLIGGSMDRTIRIWDATPLPE